MEDRKDVLPLRIVAARFVSSDEQTGLAELDCIAADASRLIQKRYWLLSISFAATVLGVWSQRVMVRLDVKDLGL